MNLIVKTGKIEQMSESTTVVGRNGNVNSMHTAALRIDGMSARLKSSNHVSLTPGDTITAVGEMKNGSLLIYCYRNETTGAFDEANLWIQILLGVCLCVLGVLTLIFIVGLFFLAGGAYVLYNAYKIKQANALLARTPRPVAAVG